MRNPINHPIPQRRLLQALGALLLFGFVSQFACVFDPNQLPQTESDRILKPPMALSQDIALPNDAKAIFVQGDVAYVCTLANSPSPSGADEFDLSAIDLTTQKLRWTAQQNACFFAANDTRVFLVKEAPNAKNELLLELRDAISGKLLQERTFGQKIATPLPVMGPGRIIQQPPNEQSSLRTKIQANLHYVLFQNTGKIWVFDTQTATLIYEDGMGLSPDQKTVAFDAMLDGNKLYQIITSTSPQERATRLDQQVSLIPRGQEQHLLSAIDLQTGAVLWQKNGLPFPISDARLALSDGQLLVQLQTNYETTQTPNYAHGSTASGAGGIHVQINEAQHYLLHPKDGSPLWQAPWVLSHKYINRAAPPALLSMSSTHAYIHANNILHALSLQNGSLAWRSQTQLEPGQIITTNNAQLLYLENEKTTLFKLSNGNLLKSWKAQLLVPMRSSNISTSDEDIIVVKRGCLLADGTQRGVTLPSGSDNFYSTAKQKGFFDVFCTKHLLELENDAYTSTSAPWQSSTHVAQGEPGTLFRHKNHLYVIVDQYRWLAFELKSERL